MSFFNFQKQVSEDTEVSTKLPDFSFEIPSTEPVAIVSKDVNVSPPSFENDTQVAAPEIVPSIQISTQPIKSTEKQLIEVKPEIKKKSSTLALCSCFGTKSNVQKEKTKTMAAPKTDLPEVEAPSPSSNITSTLKTKGPLRAPTNDLPPVDLTLPSTEPVRLPAIQTSEKKRPAPKKPSKSSKTPELAVTATVNDVQIQSTDNVQPTEVKTEEQLLIQSSPVEQVEEQITSQTPTVLSTIIEKTLDKQANVQSSIPVDVSTKEEIKVESTTTTSPIEKQSEEGIKVCSTLMIGQSIVKFFFPARIKRR